MKSSLFSAKITCDPYINFFRTWVIYEPQKTWFMLAPAFSSSFSSPPFQTQTTFFFFLSFSECPGLNFQEADLVPSQLLPSPEGCAGVLVTRALPPQPLVSHIQSQSPATSTENLRLFPSSAAENTHKFSQGYNSWHHRGTCQACRNNAFHVAWVLGGEACAALTLLFIWQLAVVFSIHTPMCCHEGLETFFWIVCFLGF